MTGEFLNLSNFPQSEIEELAQIPPILPLQAAQPTFSKNIQQFSRESQSTCKFLDQHDEGYMLYMQDHRKGNYKIGLEFGTPTFADTRVKFQVGIFTII